MGSSEADLHKMHQKAEINKIKLNLTKSKANIFTKKKNAISVQYKTGKETGTQYSTHE